MVGVLLVSAPSEHAALGTAVAAVAHYLGVVVKRGGGGEVKDDASASWGPSLVEEGGGGEEGGSVVVTGLGACVAKLGAVAEKGARARITGESDPFKAEVEDWLTRCATTLAQAPADALAELDAFLLTRTTLCDFARPGQVTAADLGVFCVVVERLRRMKKEEEGGGGEGEENNSRRSTDKNKFLNLFRWADYVHHTAKLVELDVAPLPLTMAEYVAPSLPAQEASGDKGAATKGPGKSSAVVGGKDQDSSSSKKDEKKKKKKGGEMKDDSPPPPVEGGSEKKEMTKAEIKAAKKAAKAAASAPKGAKGGGGGEDAVAELSASILDIRVGTIIEVSKHPDAEALYLEKIDLGETETRQVVSGLVKFIPEERMLGARVLVLANVKHGNLRGKLSQGMVLCASNAEHDRVDFVVPPPGSVNGERISIEGYEGEPEAVLNPKKKQFEKLAPDLQTDAEGVAVYKGVPLMTTKGKCVASIPNGNIK